MGIYGPNSAARIDIAAISEIMQPVTEDWFNATIEIIAPNTQGGAFNRMTNAKTRVIPPALWTGKARIQSMRWPNVATAKQEAISLRTVVFHIPLAEPIDTAIILEGYRIRVIDGGMAPDFEHGLFVITGTVNSSYAWDRRIETMMDQGTAV